MNVAHLIEIGEVSREHEKEGRIRTGEFEIQIQMESEIAIVIETPHESECV